MRRKDVGYVIGSIVLILTMLALFVNCREQSKVVICVQECSYVVGEDEPAYTDDELKQIFPPVMYELIRGHKIKPPNHVYIKGELHNTGNEEVCIEGWRAPLGGEFCFNLTSSDTHFLVPSATISGIPPGKLRLPPDSSAPFVCRFAITKATVSGKQICRGKDDNMGSNEAKASPGKHEARLSLYYYRPDTSVVVCFEAP